MSLLYKNWKLAKNEEGIRLVSSIFLLRRCVFLHPIQLNSETVNWPFQYNELWYYCNFFFCSTSVALIQKRCLLAAIPFFFPFRSNSIDNSVTSQSNYLCVCVVFRFSCFWNVLFNYSLLLMQNEQNLSVRYGMPCWCWRFAIFTTEQKSIKLESDSDFNHR